MYVIVLAENHREANAYAQSAQLPRGRWRFAVRASSIRGLRVAEIHELPGFSKRRDQHAINAELRFARCERTIVDAVDIPPPGLVADVDLAHEYALIEETARAWVGRVSDEIAPESLLEDQDPFAGAAAVISEPNGDIRVYDAMLAEAYAEHAQREDQALIDATRAQAHEDAAATDRKRRSRCKVCGVLTWSDDDPDHDAAAHAEATPVTVAGFFGNA